MAPYNAKYVRAYRTRVLNEARHYLGGKCVECGVTHDLEFDHIDPATKVAEVTVILYTRNLMEFWREVDKCQLLCTPCHKAKSAAERTVSHGTQRMYRSGCKCAPCLDRKHYDYRRRAAQRRAQRLALHGG